jgi:hypothetical protein
MRISRRVIGWSVGLITGLALGGAVLVSGCGSGGMTWEAYDTPFGTASPPSTGPGGTGTLPGGLGGADRTPRDPCTESQARKFVTISMRNLSEDFIHYFFVAIAFVDVDESATGAAVPFFDTTSFPDGAVCPEDVALYTQFGYRELAAGSMTAFGDFCIGGPALIYFHREGQFRRSAGTGTANLGSAIGPAQGSSPTYDAFFTSAGARVPVPDLILFHNPGTGSGAALKISSQTTAPCDVLTIAGAPPCERDSFYYVDDRDLMTGTTSLGIGSGRRVPGEIQGTGCECAGLTAPVQILAPSGVSARFGDCFEFFRGGRIDYVFVRQDETPPFPQLLSRVTDSTGAVAHDFDPRAPLP